MSSSEAAVAVPEGFERHDRRSPMTDPWEPLYARRTAAALILGLRLAEPHTNARGLIHGGLIATLADNAMGLSVALHLPDKPSLLTISLSIDYLASAGVGQWLEVETNFVKSGRSIAFAQCLVHADGAPCARGNATFKVLAKKD
ncbi:MAG: PaaI family thioesterase [Xanthobacteraceae bacterium]|nr:PaaI family thioesterase [Xanthobacteraceae bacterium]